MRPADQSKPISKPVDRFGSKKSISKDTFIKGHERVSKGYTKKHKKG